MRAHLDDYAKEINDLLTTRAELDRFAEFNVRLSMLNGYTKSCYQMKEDGTYPALTEEEVQIIRESYQAALPDDELRQFAGQDDGEQLKQRYIRELARDKETELHEQARQEKAEPALQNQARRQEARNAQQGGPAIGKQ